MPGITREQRIAFVQKYNAMFDEEVLVDQGAFKGLKVKDADRAMVENFGQQSCLEWLLSMIENTNREKDIQQVFSEFLEDPKYTFVAIRHHFSVEGSLIVSKFLGKPSSTAPTWAILNNYANSHGYCW